MNGSWVRTKKACGFFGIHPNTLRRHADSGMLEFKRTPGGQRIYRIGYNAPVLQSQSEKTCFIYIRVSSSKQKDDLKRQEQYMLSQFPNFTVIKDIGSGLNFKRKGLIKLLELSNKGLVQKVVVASKDRLCRFGYDLLSWTFTQNNTELLVLNQIDKSPEEEFTEDILAVLQVFACRWNGKRSFSLKNKKDQIKIDISTEADLARVES